MWAIPTRVLAVRDLTMYSSRPWALQKRMNRSRCRLEDRLGWVMLDGGAHRRHMMNTMDQSGRRRTCTSVTRRLVLLRSWLRDENVVFSRFDFMNFWCNIGFWVSTDSQSDRPDYRGIRRVSIASRGNKYNAWMRTVVNYRTPPLQRGALLRRLERTVDQVAHGNDINNQGVSPRPISACHNHSVPFWCKWCSSSHFGDSIRSGFQLL